MLCLKSGSLGGGQVPLVFLPVGQVLPWSQLKCQLAGSDFTPPQVQHWGLSVPVSCWRAGSLNFSPLWSGQSKLTPSDFPSSRSSELEPRRTKRPRIMEARAGENEHCKHKWRTAQQRGLAMNQLVQERAGN